MARTVLAVQDIIRDGLTVSYTAGDAAVDHSFDNEDGNVFLHVIKGATGNVVVTIDNPSVVDGEDMPDKVVTVLVDTEQMIGPFPKVLYEQPDADSGVTRSILVDIDIDTNVTLAAVRLPDPSYQSV